MNILSKSILEIEKKKKKKKKALKKTPVPGTSIFFCRW